MAETCAVRSYGSTVVRAGLYKKTLQTGESCKRSLAGRGGQRPSRVAAHCLSSAGTARRDRNERTLCNIKSCNSQFLGDGATSSDWGRVKARSTGGRRGALGASCDMSVLPEVVSQGLSDLPHNLAMLPHFMLGVGVGLPCTVMDCGDVIYRSTLPKPSALQLTYGGVTLLSLISAYLWATPGVAPGFWDMFILSPLEGFIRPKYTQDDLVLGKKLGEGAYGTVYRAELKTGKGAGTALVVKKASEFGAAEAWMNERVRRACPKACAEYVYGFVEEKTKGRFGQFWLVWKFEGSNTLADVLVAKDFPYSLEDSLFGGPLRLRRGPERESKIIQAVMKQILVALKQLHRIGIVHRDIKPQNIVYCKETGQLKIIDLGAAADLRVGINYVPKEFLLDPRYCAPEQYIMSTQTPSAPPPPVAAALSPVLWQMNLPDRFDVYSAGLIMLQMAFPHMRSDNGLIQFNRQLKRCGYDLDAWREVVLTRPTADISHGFEILDLDNGLGWDLVRAMVRYKARKRISAGGALGHPFFTTNGILAVQGVAELRCALGNSFRADTDEWGQWIFDMMAKSGTEKEGGFTEAQLADIRQKSKKRKGTLQRNSFAAALKLQRKVEKTITSVAESVDEAEKQQKADQWWDRWSTKVPSVQKARR